MNCQGGVEYVISNGRVTVDEGQLKAVQGYGTFIPTEPFAPYVYDAVAQREQSRKLIKTEMEGRVVAVRAAPSLASNGHAAQVDAAANGLAAVKVSMPTPLAQPSPTGRTMEHFTRGPTSSGGRNMQDTTFSLSAEYPSKSTPRMSFKKKHKTCGKANELTMSAVTTN